MFVSIEKLDHLKVRTQLSGAINMRLGLPQRCDKHTINERHTRDEPIYKIYIYNTTIIEQFLLICIYKP